MRYDPVFSSIRELSKHIYTKQVSPVELTKLFLDRLGTIGSNYNAVVTITERRAIHQARRAEKEIMSGHYRGILHGIPYGAKDLLATSGGIPTTWGASPFKNQVFDYDATVIQNLESAGAILVAKMAMVELAGGMGYRQPNASFTGPGISPWGSDRWSGGSSSGSGSGVSAGLVPFAIGSETWGSILIPANNCGVTGLRPTYGRVSRYGAMALSWTLDKLGPLCLTADDCGLVLEAIAGPDPNDDTTSNQSFSYHPRLTLDRRFRLGVLKNITENAQDSVRNNFDQALKDLESVATLEEVELPNMPYEAIIQTILFAEAASSFDEFIESGKTSELTAPEDRYGPFARTAVLAKDYLNASRLRRVVSNAADEILTKYDGLVAPTCPEVAPCIDQQIRGSFRGSGEDIMGALGNLAGLPAISVPSGLSCTGLPTGIQFMGRAYEDNKVIALASAYQSLTNWHKDHPPELLQG